MNKGTLRKGISKTLRQPGTVALTTLIISECESLVEWNSDVNSNVTVDNTIFLSGTGSLQLIRDNNTLTSYSADIDYVADLSTYTRIAFEFYAIDKRFLSTIVIKFFTTVGKADTDCLFYSIPVSSVSNGWNSFNQLCTAFTQAGVGTWADVVAVRFEINLTE